MREPKSVMAGIRQRGWWDVVRDRRDKGALEVEIIEDAVVYASESLEFELDVSCTEPLEESNFVVVQEGSLEDVSDSLMLLCVRQWVVDVAGNGRLSVRYICKTIFELVPHRCSPGLSTGSCSLPAHTLRAGRQVERYARMTVAKGCRLRVYLSTDGGTTGWLCLNRLAGSNHS